MKQLKETEVWKNKMRNCCKWETGINLQSYKGIKKIVFIPSIPTLMLSTLMLSPYIPFINTMPQRQKRDKTWRKEGLGLTPLFI